MIMNLLTPTSRIRVLHNHIGSGLCQNSGPTPQSDSMVLVERWSHRIGHTNNAILLGVFPFYCHIYTSPNPFIIPSLTSHANSSLTIFQPYGCVYNESFVLSKFEFLIIKYYCGVKCKCATKAISTIVCSQFTCICSATRKEGELGLQILAFF